VRLDFRRSVSGVLEEDKLENPGQLVKLRIRPTTRAARYELLISLRSSCSMCFPSAYSMSVFACSKLAAGFIDAFAAIKKPHVHRWTSDLENQHFGPDPRPHNELNDPVMVLVAPRPTARTPDRHSLLVPSTGARNEWLSERS
jgi:hypothetical protein